MAKDLNILNELKELNSSLAGHTPEGSYTVPKGYFDQFYDQLMLKIKALENEEQDEKHLFISDLSKAETYSIPAGYFDNLASEVLMKIKASEIEEANFYVSGFPKTNPYTAPAGYFESFAENMVQLATNEYETADEELASISPLLHSLKNKNPYTLPTGYFESLEVILIPEKEEAKVISFTSRKWFKYAAAAAIIGFIAFTGIKIFNPSSPVKPEDVVAKTESAIKKDINSNKITNEDIENFLDFADAGLENDKTTAVVIPKNFVDTKSILKGVSDKELEQFLDEMPFNDNEPLILN